MWFDSTPISRLQTVSFLETLRMCSSVILPRLPYLSFQRTFDVLDTPQDIRGGPLVKYANPSSKKKPSLFFEPFLGTL